MWRWSCLLSGLGLNIGIQFIWRRRFQLEPQGFFLLAWLRIMLWKRLDWSDFILLSPESFYFTPVLCHLSWTFRRINTRFEFMQSVWFYGLRSFRGNYSLMLLFINVVVFFFFFKTGINFSTLDFLDELLELITQLSFYFCRWEHGNIHEISRHLYERLAKFVLQNLVKEKHAIQVPVFLPLDIFGDLAKSFTPSFNPNSLISLEIAIICVSFLYLHHHSNKFIV